MIGPLASVARPYRVESSQSFRNNQVVVMPVDSVVISTDCYLSGDLDLARSSTAVAEGTTLPLTVSRFGIAGLAGLATVTDATGGSSQYDATCNLLHC